MKSIFVLLFTIFLTAIESAAAIRYSGECVEKKNNKIEKSELILDLDNFPQSIKFSSGNRPFQEAKYKIPTPLNSDNSVFVVLDNYSFDINWGFKIVVAGSYYADKQYLFSQETDFNFDDISGQLKTHQIQRTYFENTVETGNEWNCSY